MIVWRKRVNKKTVETPEWRKDLVEVLQTNSTLLTVFTVVSVILTGITVIEGTSRWWAPLLLTFTLTTIIFFLINAKVVIKVLTSVFLALLFNSLGFLVSVQVLQELEFGLLWFISGLFVYSATITISYLIASSQSRWNMVTITQLLFFTLFGLTASLTSNPIFSSLLSITVSVLLFIVFYRFNFKNRHISRGMPKNIINDEIVEIIDKEASFFGWDYRVLINEKKEGNIFLWGEYEGRTVLLNLYPIVLEQGFGLIGKKTLRLSYLGRNINPWLLRTIHKTSLPWKLRGASPMLILLDIKTANGSKAKTIGVSIPDSKKKVPVGIIPIKKNRNGETRLIKESLSEYYKMLTPLNDKQIKALEEIGQSARKKTGEK